MDLIIHLVPLSVEGMGTDEVGIEAEGAIGVAAKAEEGEALDPLKVPVQIKLKIGIEIERGKKNTNLNTEQEAMIRRWRVEGLLPLKFRTLG